MLARQNPRYGYRRLHALLSRRGHEVNVKRVYKLYLEEKLMVRRKKRKRLLRERAVEPRLLRANQESCDGFRRALGYADGESASRFPHPHSLGGYETISKSNLNRESPVMTGWEIGGRSALLCFCAVFRAILSAMTCISVGTKVPVKDLPTLSG